MTQTHSVPNHAWRASLALLFSVSCSVAAAAQEPSWWATMYKKNSQYVEVYLDMRDMPPSAIARDARVSVQFFDANNHRLGIESFPVTGAEVGELLPGGQYYTYVKHSQQGATGAAGIDFRSSLDEKGRYFAKKIALGPQEGRPIPSGATLIGASPDSLAKHKKKAKKARCVERGEDCPAPAQ